ncbi:MAG: DUF3325 family protein [Pseudomonadota bacterium]
MMLALGFIATVVGSTFLCVSLRRHYIQVFPNSKYSRNQAYVHRVVGYALLFAGLILCSMAMGVAKGSVMFFALLSVAIFSLAVGLPFFLRRT